MTSDEAVNNDKNYNGNVRSNWQTAIICYLTFYACVFQFLHMTVFPVDLLWELSSILLQR